MRKRLILVFILHSLLSLNAQDAHKSLSFGVAYGNIHRAQLETYLKTAMNCMGISLIFMCNMEE